MIDKLGHLLGIPELAGGELGRNGDEGEVLFLVDDLGWAMLLYQFQIVPALAGPVQKEHQGPLLILLLRSAVPLRKEEKIAELDRFFLVAALHHHGCFGGNLLARFGVVGTGKRRDEY